jgi:type I restriction enzyme M protein
VYVLVQDSWAAGKVLRQLVGEGEKLKETPDRIIDKSKYKTDLIHGAACGALFCDRSNSSSTSWQADPGCHSPGAEALIEEHSGEEGLLS